MQSFTVTLNSEEVIDKASGQTLAQYLGRGHVVDTIHEKSTFKFTSEETHVVGFDLDGNQVEKTVTGERTMETVLVKYLVLWEGNPSPKIHDASTINWELTSEQYKIELEEENEEVEEFKKVVFYDSTNTMVFTEETYDSVESFYEEFPDAVFVGFLTEEEGFENDVTTLLPTIESEAVGEEISAN
jgi:hypothetical protein